MGAFFYDTSSWTSKFKAVPFFPIFVSVCFSLCLPIGNLALSCKLPNNSVGVVECRNSKKVQRLNICTTTVGKEIDRELKDTHVVEIAELKKAYQ